MPGTRPARHRLGPLIVAACLAGLAACTAPRTVAPDPSPPADPPAYAQAALDALAAGDTAALARLTAPAAADQLREIAGQHPGMRWSLVRSGTDGAVAVCVFRDQEGAELTVRVHQPISGDHQVTGVSLAAPGYPGSAPEYTAELVRAWQAGNGARLLALAGANIADYLSEHPPPTGTPVLTPGTEPGGTVTVRITAPGVDLTVRYDPRGLGRARAVQDLRDNRARQTIAGD